jgi:WS/DGAT/MGAT family acyltransferase
MSNHTRSAQPLKFEDFMSENDTTLWVGERDPRLRSTIMSVWLLDRMPDGGDFEEMLADTVEAIPRLRQRVVRDPYEIAPPRWENDPHFDPRFHIRKLHLGGLGTLRELLDLAEPIAMQAFDKDRPLWEFYLVDGLEGGRAGVIMKLHHAVSDGVGLVKMTGSMMEKEPGAARAKRGTSQRISRQPGQPEAEALTSQQLVRDAIEHQSRAGLSMMRRMASGATELANGLLRTPEKTIENAREMVGSIGRLLEPITVPLSPIMRDRGMALSLNAFAVPLEDMKKASRIMGGSVNDVFVTAVAGGMKRYHEHCGQPVEELNMMMPINLRKNDDTGSEAGNQFAPSRFRVPVGIEDPHERLEEIQVRVKAQRKEVALDYLGDILGVVNRLPNAVTDRLMEGLTTSVDFVTSNVPGPRRPVFTSGARILQMFPFGPPAGAAVNITLFSYDGRCHVGINADRDAVSEPELLAECMQKSFGEVLAIEE